MSRRIMIFDKHKTIFIHIPRNAGCSVCHELGEESNHASDFETIAELREKNPKAVLSYYKWTIVRNPWDRELSLYRYALDNNIVKDVNFEEYLGKIKKQSIDNKILERNQVDYFTKNNYIELDQIVRLEYISGAWKKVCEQLNIEATELEHINKSENTKNHYNQKCIDLVAEIRKKDIEFLNYDCPY